MADGNTPQKAPEKVPEQETRGGDRIDWAATRPGQPLRKEPPLEDQVPAEPAPRESE